MNNKILRLTANSSNKNIISYSDIVLQELKEMNLHEQFRTILRMSSTKPLLSLSLITKITIENN